MVSTSDSTINVTSAAEEAAEEKRCALCESLMLREERFALDSLVEFWFCRDCRGMSAFERKALGELMAIRKLLYEIKARTGWGNT